MNDELLKKLRRIILLNQGEISRNVKAGTGEFPDTEAALRAWCLEVVAASVPEKPGQVEGNKLPYINRGYIEGEVNGTRKTIDQTLSNARKQLGLD